MRVVLDRSAEVAEFVASIMPYPGYDRGFDTVSAIGVEENGALIGGTVFHDWNPDTGVIEMSSASISPRWLCRKMIDSIFTYVFEIVKVRVVIMRVSELNERMVKIARNFGFKEYLLPELAGEGVGLFVFTMSKHQWVESPFNRRKAA